MARPTIPLSEMFRYLRTPHFLTKRGTVDVAALRHILHILFLVLAVVFILSGVIGAMIVQTDGTLPDNANEALGRNSPMRFLLIGVIVAPILEELIFRSWLGGQRACIIGLPILAAIAALLSASMAGLSGTVTMVMAAIFALFILALARRYAALAPESQDMARRRLFPAAFYGSALLFGLIHLANYEGGLSSPIMLLAVMPQALVGLVLAYMRMRFGLITAILFHAAYNAVLIGLFMLGTSLSETGASTEVAMISATWFPALVGAGVPH